MLSEILAAGAEKHGFERVGASADAEFFRRKVGGAERYLILKVLDALGPIEEIHEGILKSVPESLMSEPAFSKNCDLVLIHQMARLSDFKAIEKTILAYEEDPYHFKKYFLYYIAAEEATMAGKTYADFERAIPDKRSFAEYKTDPLRPSFYSFAARIFIKLPFLEVPRSERKLVPLAVEVDAAVSEAGMADLLEKVAVTDLESIDEFVQGLINEELENLKAADSGV